MKQATKEDAQQIRKEELSVVLGAVRNYPWKQLKASAKNFVIQCLKVRHNFRGRPEVDNNIVDVFPITGNKYFRSRQYYQTRLPSSLIIILQCMSVLAAAFSCILIGFRLQRRIPDRLFVLTALTLIGLLSNNLITGVISAPLARYHCRILWLVPMLSILFLYVWADDIQKDEKGSRAKTRIRDNYL